MKKLQILHDVVEVIIMAIIAGAMIAIIAVDFRALGGSQATLLTIAQVIVVFTCVPGGYKVKEAIDSLFEWVEEKISEETEEN